MAALADADVPVVAFALAFEVAFVATLFVAAGVAACVAAGVAACVAAAVVTVPPVVGPPSELESELADVVELNCGGVIAKTAPRPPTVPPAINNARFMR